MVHCVSKTLIRLFSEDKNPTKKNVKNFRRRVRFGSFAINSYYHTRDQVATKLSGAFASTSTWIRFIPSFSFCTLSNSRFCGLSSPMVIFRWFWEIYSGSRRLVTIGTLHSLVTSEYSFNLHIKNVLLGHFLARIFIVFWRTVIDIPDLILALW